MKKITYIGFFAMLLLFSCSKEQPLQPINTGETYTPSMLIISETKGNTNPPTTSTINGNNNTTKNSDGNKNGNSDSNDDITDPEKGDGKGKSNKKAKN